MGTSALARRATSVLLVGVALLGGCLPLPGGRTLTRKEIASKDSDALIATDGSRCPAGASTLDAKRVGEEHLCAWVEPDAQRDGSFGTEPRRPGRVPTPTGRP